MISRRHLIKNLVISVGGSSLLSACGGRVTLGTAPPGAPLRFYSEHEMAVLSRVSDLFLPRTETPGALDANVPAMLDQLMAEWASNETLAEHRAALVTLDMRLQEASGGDFLAATEAVAGEALVAVDNAAFSGDSVEGYRGLKGLITQTYFATEAGSEEREWVGAPGRWDPCLDRS